MKYKIIANPAAGKGKGKALIPKVEQKLRSLGLDFDLTCTERPWHAAEIASQAAKDGYNAVIAAGGDGTCNEVINGLMMAPRNGKQPPAFGVICIGRGNDFAFGANIPTGWEAGCETIARGKRQPIDIGKVSGDCMERERYFGNGMGMGFDATVNIQATKTRIGGFAGYFIAVLRTLLLYFNSPLVQIQCDSTTIEQPSLMVSIMNGRRMGGGFIMAPDSSSTDGSLDLCIAHKVDRLTILSMIPSFLRGTQGSHPAVRFERSKKVTVTALDGVLPMQVDGEMVCTNGKKVDVEVLPGAIELLF